jgi:hypothetical protein
MAHKLAKMAAYEASMKINDESSNEINGENQSKSKKYSQ